MIKYLIAFCIIIIFFGCSSETVIVNSQTKLSDSSKVEWVITKEDSTIDFRKSNQGYAKVQNNFLLFATENDTVNKLSVNELKVLYLKEETSFTTYIVGGIVAVIVVVSYVLHNVDLTGG